MFVPSTCERLVILLGACTALACVVAGCSHGPEDTPQTVDYYRKHPEDRQILLGRCTNDPGRLGGKPACINAQQAENLEGIGSMRDLPPMGLSNDGSPTSSGGAAQPAAPPNR